MFSNKATHNSYLPFILYLVMNNFNFKVQVSFINRISCKSVQTHGNSNKEYLLFAFIITPKSIPKLYDVTYCFWVNQCETYEKLSKSERKNVYYVCHVRIIFHQNHSISLSGSPFPSRLSKTHYCGNFLFQ